MTATPDFPSPAKSPIGLGGRVPPGTTLRAATGEDLPFLRVLYGQTRERELAAMHWPDSVAAQFLDDQFALQHRHYVTHFQDALFLIIEANSDPVGRLYTGLVDDDWRIIDISVMASHQRRGLGRSLIDALKDRAARDAKGVCLHVDARNVGAQRLYRSLGFVFHASEPPYFAARWCPTPVS